MLIGLDDGPIMDGTAQIQMRSEDDLPGDRRGTAYSSSWEHLADELKYLDLLLRLRTLDVRSRHPASPLDQFKGLVLSDDEIGDLTANLPFSEEGSAGSVTSEQQRLSEELARSGSLIEGRRAAAIEAGVTLLLPYLSELFYLTRFEEQCLLTCLAPELDRRYEKLYGYLQDDVTRKNPSVDLILGLLCGTREEKLLARVAFEPSAPLLKYRLIEMSGSAPDGSVPLLGRTLKLDDRLVNFLLGIESIDSRLAHSSSPVWPRMGWEYVEATSQSTERMRRFVEGDLKERWATPQRTIFYFYGPDETGKRDLAEAAATELGRPLLTCDAETLLEGAVGLEESAWILGREALLRSAVLCIERVEALQSDKGKPARQVDSLLDAAQTFSPVTFLFGEKRWKPERLSGDTAFIEADFPIPPAHVRKNLWAGTLNGDHRIAVDPELGALASKFRLTSGQIKEAVVTAHGLARWSGSGDVTLSDLHAACRLYSQQELGTLARKIEPVYRWPDIVLPEDSLTQLHEMCGRVAQRQRVLSEWGFGSKLSLGTGISALFVGASGTGKTMAAEIIASELELDLYKIDLSGAVSKYIGETEKNLERIFTAAENANAILFFDEADALFGKRSEVRDSHDRYANIEVAYLLQRIEQYEGVAILSTNLRQNIDEAFLRRLQFIVDFPFPDESHRELIWQTLFSSEAPCAREIDFGLLARLFRISGGNIRNIILGAAYLAAAGDEQIDMTHFVQAARREYQKLGKLFPEAELLEFSGPRNRIKLME